MTGHPMVELLELEVMNPNGNTKIRSEEPFFFELENDTEWSTSIFNEKTLTQISKDLDESIGNCIKDLVDLAENHSLSAEPLLPSEKELSIQSKIDDNFIQANAVNDLWVLRSGIQEIDVLVELGELGQALSSLETVRSRLDAFGNAHKGTALEVDIKKHIDEILTTIKERLDKGWSSAIVFNEESDCDSLTVKQMVEDDLSLQVIYEALQVIDSSEVKVGIRSNRVESLLRSIERRIFDPILELKLKSAIITDNKLELKRADSGEKLIVNNIIEALKTSIKFLQSSFEPPLLSVVISKRFSSPIIQKLTNRTLPGLFPNDSSSLSQFRRQLDEVIEFEKFLSDEVKWISVSTHDLTHWVNDFINEWVIYRKATYLDELRQTIFEDIKLERYSGGSTIQGTTAATSRVDPASDEWNWNEEEEENGDGKEKPANTTESKPIEQAQDEDDDFEDESWGWGDDDTNKQPQPQNQSTKEMPAEDSYSQEQLNSLTSTTITSAVDKVAQLIKKFTKEVEDQCSTLSRHVSDILDLYRSLSPILYEQTPSNIPSPLIISYNDLITLAALAENGTIANVFNDDIERLKQVANHQLTKVLEENQSKILSYLSTANRFFDCTGDNQENSELSIGRVMALMRGLAEEWRTYTSYPVTVQLLGSILETGVVSIIESIESHQDISEAESVQLSNIITTISSLEDIFDNPDVQRRENQSFAAFYVPSWIKFQYLNEILQSKLVDITFMHSSNALVDYSSSELINLIKALFVDSEYRRKAIDEISRQQA